MSTTKYIGLNMKAYGSRLLQHLFQFRMFVSVLMNKVFAPQFSQLHWLNTRDSEMGFNFFLLNLYHIFISFIVS